MSTSGTQGGQNDIRDTSVHWTAQAASARCNNTCPNQRLVFYRLYRRATNQSWWLFV